MKKEFIILIWLLLSCILVVKAQHSLKKLPFPVNTLYYNEICPVFANDEKTMFFTRVGSPDFNKTLIINDQDLYASLAEDAYYDKLSAVYTEIAGRTVSNPVNTGYNQDVHLAIVDQDTIRLVYHPGYPLNNALPNSICSPSASDNTFVVINQFEEKGGMHEGFSFVKVNENFESTFPEAIIIDEFDKNAHEVNFTLSPDESFVLLAMSQQPDQPKDLFVCEKKGERHYSKPLPLWRINTSFDESTPFLSKTGKRLYFASDRPGGQGGKDIWVSEREDQSPFLWKEVECLKYPVNSPFNESHPCVFSDEDRMYFTSDRDGNSDIFTVRLKRSLLSGKIKVNIIALKEDGSGFPAEISWGSAFDGEEIEWKGYFRSRNGKHVVYLDENKPFYVKAENRALATETRMIEPQELIDKGINEITIQLKLQDKYSAGTVVMQTIAKEESVLPLQLQSGMTTVLHNIYFEQASDQIRNESYANLYKLAEALIRNPQLSIVVEGHTDNVGDKKDLIDLSNARAVAIKKILVGYGVDEKRIGTMGFGATKPLTDNKTEEKRQKNRRVEIRIL